MTLLQGSHRICLGAGEGHESRGLPDSWVAEQFPVPLVLRMLRTPLSSGSLETPEPMVAASV